MVCADLVGTKRAEMGEDRLAGLPHCLGNRATCALGEGIAPDLAGGLSCGRWVLRAVDVYCLCFGRLSVECVKTIAVSLSKTGDPIDAESPLRRPILRSGIRIPPLHLSGFGSCGEHGNLARDRV